MPLVRSVHTTYQCRYCGHRETRTENQGKPSPGYCSKNKDSKGKYLPHSWVIVKRG